MHTWPACWQTQARAALSQSDGRYWQTLNSKRRKNQFLAGRRLLLQLSEWATGDALTLSRNAAGVPQTQHPYHISIAHSGNWVAASIGKNTAVGVDIEQHRPRRFKILAQYYFAPTESHAIAQASAAERAAIFYRAWTGKEAVAKLHGQGLSRTLLRQSEPELQRNQSVHYANGSNVSFALATATPCRINWWPENSRLK